MKKAINDYKQEVRELRSKIRCLESEKFKIERDRQKHRLYLRDNFEWFIDLLGENKHPSVGPLIKDMTKHFIRCEKFDLDSLPRVF